MYESLASVTSRFVRFIWLLVDSRPMFYLIHLCLLFTFDSGYFPFWLKYDSANRQAPDRKITVTAFYDVL